MKPYKYLITNGCSFTHGATLPNASYQRFGQLIANKLNIDNEINLSIHGGSNDRIVRTTFDWITKNKDKCKDSLMIIGLTESFREDVWSNNINDYVKFQYPNLEEPADVQYFTETLGITDDEYKEFVIPYFKTKLLFFLNEKFLKQKLHRDIVLIDTYAKKFGLDIVWFDALLDYGNWEWQTHFVYEYHKWVVEEKDKFIKDNNLNYFKFPNNEKNWKKYMHNVDNSYQGNHPNIEQHQHFSEILWEYLNEKFK